MTGHQSAARTLLVSIIIPVRHDAEALARTLDHLCQLPGMDAAEVIVAAAGDREGTERAVAGQAQLLWPDGSSHAILMNAAAARARGEVLFFLHADSFPPTQAIELIMQALSDRNVVGGRRSFGCRCAHLGAAFWPAARGGPSFSSSGSCCCIHCGLTPNATLNAGGVRRIVRRGVRGHIALLPSPPVQ